MGLYHHTWLMLAMEPGGRPGVEILLSILLCGKGGQDAECRRIALEVRTMNKVQAGACRAVAVNSLSSRCANWGVSGRNVCVSVVFAPFRRRLY